MKRFSERFRGVGPEDSSDGDSIYSFGGREEDETGMRKIRPGDIISIKKERRLGFEGFILTARDGKVRSKPAPCCVCGRLLIVTQSWRLTNVARRDEAFNKLIGITSCT